MSATHATRLEYLAPRIAILTFDLPGKGANVLSRSVLEEIGSQLDALEGNRNLDGLILRSGKPGQFLAGADLREFMELIDSPHEVKVELFHFGQQVLRRLSRVPFVTVCAIEGACLGGGAEVAAWCDRRILVDHPKTRFGFPEVQLGLIPGWGGTVRSPRIVGLPAAIEMICGGEAKSASQAAALGWGTLCPHIDQLVPSARSLVEAETQSRSFLADRERWNRPLELGDAELASLQADASEKLDRQTHGHFPAPREGLAVLLKGQASSIDDACDLEAEGIARLFGSPTNRALLHVFFLSDANKKDRGGIDPTLAPRVVRTVCVVGDSDLATGITAACKQYDGRNVSLARAEASTIASDLVLVVSDAPANALPEILRIERDMKPTGTLAISCGRPMPIPAEPLSHPDRCVGLQFYAPFEATRLVEVTLGDRTSAETAVTALQFSRSLGKMPIVVRDAAGGVVRRLRARYLHEAIRLVDEGVPAPVVDLAAREFGMALGPIEFHARLGWDPTLQTAKSLESAFPARFPISPTLERLAAGRAAKEAPAGLQPSADRPPLGERTPVHQDIADRLVFSLLLEASDLLVTGSVRKPSDLDLASLYGVGFPTFLGGLIHWADCVGPRAIAEKIGNMGVLGDLSEAFRRFGELARTQGRICDWLGIFPEPRNS